MLINDHVVILCILKDTIDGMKVCTQKDTIDSYLLKLYVYCSKHFI